MATSPNLATSHSSQPAAVDEARSEVSAIDLSLCSPVSFFLPSAVAWLLLATVFALIGSFQLHSPTFLGDCEYLTYGRVRPAELNIFVYGWGMNVAFGVAFWIIGRLARSVLTHSSVLVVAGIFWNLGVAIGIVGILLGDSTSLPFLEIPGYATPLLFIAYLLVGAWGVMAFRSGKSKYGYISQLYIFAALFWFPWFYSVAQIMGVFAPARGTVQSIVAGWYGSSLLGLWFTPIALAAIYYFIPKVLGKPIYNYYLAPFGFWALAIFAGWTGATGLIGGPVPVWAQSASLGASWALLIAVVLVGINQLPPILKNFSAVSQSPTLRFVAFGAVNYALIGLIGVFTSNRGMSELLQFSFFNEAYRQHVLYAFFSMVMFGAVYYLLPRVLVKAWPSTMLIQLHFWTTATGSALGLLALYIGGAQQGALLNTTETPLLAIVKTVRPYLIAESLGWMLLLIGHLGFAVNVFWLLGKRRDATETPALLFSVPTELEVVSR